MTLTVNEIPSHTHAVTCAATGTTDNPLDAVFAGSQEGTPTLHPAQW